MDVNSINLIRVVSLLLMVNIHVAVRGMATLHDHWWIANVLDSVSRVCVPLFFMLSGALLIDKQEGLAVFFRKRAVKILAPLVAWSLVYLAFRFYVGGEEKVRVVDIFSGPVYFHLWFMYAIIGLYFAMPLLRGYYAAAPRSLNVYVLSCWALGFSIIPCLQSFGYLPMLGFSLEFLPKYAGFMLLGVLLKGIVEKRVALISAVCFVLLTGLTVWLTKWVSEPVGVLDERFYGYLAPNVVLMSIAAFIFLNWLGRGICSSFTGLLNELSACSFGAYLAHMLIMQVLLLYGAEMIPPWDTRYIALTIPLLTIVVFVLSLVATFLLRRLSVTRVLFT